MKIQNLRLEKKGNRNRVAAAVIWEDCDRPTQELYFETDQRFAKDLSCTPHAFLVGCLLPAMYYGEERISIDAEICPEFRDGLMTAMGWMHHWWYTPKQKQVRIEAKAQVSPPFTPPRAGFFFSGGIDSLATLRANRPHYPLKHPGSIKDGLLVYGLEVREPESFEYVINSLSVLAKDADITLVPVYTNIRQLGPDNDREFWAGFWINEFMGAVFAAIAHVFSKRLTSVSINSSHDISNIIPHGSHPLVDPNYSSSFLRIRYEGIALSRFAKTKLITDWDLALRHLRVCNETKHYQAGMLNCGRCEKCVRTMLALLALGVLENTPAFPRHDVTEELINATGRLAPNTFPLYGELLGPLAERGRDDLLRAVKRKMDAYHEFQWKMKWRKRMLDPIKEFDGRYLKSNLKKLKKLVHA